MNSKLVWIAMALFVIALLLLLTIANNQPSQNATSNSSTFTFNNVTYKLTGVELTLAQQEHGLMNTTVTNSTFMLFAFSTSGIYPFWMRDTYYPLDIIWINGTKVVYIASATPCSSYSPNQSACIIYNNFSEGHYANYVIETQAGFTNRTAMSVGSTVTIHLNQSG